MKNINVIYVMALLTITQLTIFVIQMFFMNEPCSSLLIIPEIMILLIVLFIRKPKEK